MQLLNTSGDQDKCFYNFKCVHPLGIISSFNNVWSNIGFILLGFLFMLIVTARWEAITPHHGQYRYHNIRGGTEGGAGGAIAPPLFRKKGRAPLLFQNKCAKCSSTAQQNCADQRLPRWFSGGKKLKLHEYKIMAKISSLLTSRYNKSVSSRACASESGCGKWKFSLCAYAREF